MTHQTEAERAEFEDGAWYWVEKDGWIGDPPTITPALYKAASKAWYSFAFSGIPTRQVKVLEPCRRAPAAPVPQSVTGLLTIDEYQEKHRQVYVMNDDERYGYECLYEEIIAGIQRPALAVAPQPPEAASMISSREVVSKPGSGVTVTRLNLSDVGRAALQSKANHIADAAPQPPEPDP